MVSPEQSSEVGRTLRLANKYVETGEKTDLESMEAHMIDMSGHAKECGCPTCVSAAMIATNRYEGELDRLTTPYPPDHEEEWIMDRDGTRTRAIDIYRGGK